MPVQLKAAGESMYLLNLRLGNDTADVEAVGHLKADDLVQTSSAAIGEKVTVWTAKEKSLVMGAGVNELAVSCQV
ncbi:MAG: hypothetical protein ACI9KE_000598 [Polyangiales bacterium]|jgi:hypothetical protein